MRTTFLVGLCSAVLLSSLVSFAAGDASKGKAAYDKRCAKCHGEKGDGMNKDGSGPANKKLDLDALSEKKMPDFSKSAEVAKMPDQRMFDAIKKGGDKVKKDVGGKEVAESDQMPDYDGKLSDAEIWDVIAYIKSLGK